jgi:hypothetical protein
MTTGKIIGIFTLFIALLCCKKESPQDFKSSGVITGPDYRACVCCGGFFIQIDTITYEFNTLPAGSDINLQTETFPIAVKLDWKFPENSACPNNRIEILRIKRQ